MTVKTYLDYISTAAYVRDEERNSINNSLSFLESRLKSALGSEISNQFVFGSYSRGTILSRAMDEESDVDYMVVFKDGGLKPQSYLDKLKRFVEANYSRSQIEQSNPTIKLSLNHIRFELVPATSTLFYGLQIPAKASSSQGWVGTDPNGFNNKLTEKNKTHGNFIKPLARCVKYWNAANGYPFESYDLEQKIVDSTFSGKGFFSVPDLESYFIEFMSNLSLPWLSAEWKTQRLQRMKQAIASVKSNSDDPVRAENELKKVLPDPHPNRSALVKALLGTA